MAIVLKSEQATDTTPAARNVTGLAGFNLSDLADEGRHRLEQCREQIRSLLAEAEQQATQIREDAQRQGYQAGLEQAAVDADRKRAEEAERLAEDQLRLIRQAVIQMHETYQSWMEEYAASLKSIAIAAAERVVGRQLEQDSSLLAQWTDDALQQARSATQLTVAVHPETLAQLGQSLDELLAGPGMPEQTQVVPDETVAKQGVVVRQPGGEIDAGLKAQLKRLEETLA